MPESFIQGPPDSTGKKLRARNRTVGADNVYEPYVITQAHDRVAISRVWCASFRLPSTVNTTVNHFSIYNTGTNPVSVRRLSVEASTVQAHANHSPFLRLYRVAAAPTAGTVVPVLAQDTSDPAINAGVVVRASASADGTSGTAVSATPSPAISMWAQVLPRYHTLAGFSPPPAMNLLPDDSMLNSEDPLILRTNEGCLVRMENVVAPAFNGMWQLFYKAVITEFTVP